MMESSTGACRMKCSTLFLSSTSTASRPCTRPMGICRRRGVSARALWRACAFFHDAGHATAVHIRPALPPQLQLSAC